MTITDVAHTIALLERTPAALDALLRDLPEVWTARNEGAGTWSPSDVVSHLMHAERTNWMPRLRAMRQDDMATFDAFDRHGFDIATPIPLASRLDDFARLRSAHLAELRAMSLQPHDLERRGRHPAAGVVTVSQLLATWAAHDLTHLHQITRVMAHQSRDAVGPWGPYLGVLRCEGHGA